MFAVLETSPISLGTSVLSSGCLMTRPLATSLGLGSGGKDQVRQPASKQGEGLAPIRSTGRETLHPTLLVTHLAPYIWHSPFRAGSRSPIAGTPGAMELNEKMEAITKESLHQVPLPPVDYHALDPEFGGCCPCCDCCPNCCDSCPNLCCCCPSCCCPPSCACCCRCCCFLPSLLCKLPKFPSCPVHIKRLLIIVVVVVLVVVIIVGVLLMGLYVTQAHTETVLRMTIGGLGGGGESQLDLPVDTEETATFNVDDGINAPATLIYNFNKLLIGYKCWHRQACYIARMDKGNIPGLDASLKEFQTKLSIMPPTQREAAPLPPSLVDRSFLGTTINVLCSHVPVFWA